MTVVVLVAAIGSAALSLLRWLRVAQREHYLAGVGRFALRWWASGPRSIALAAVGLGGLVASGWTPWGAVVTAAVAAAGPPGLGVRGRTSRLAWTPRLFRLAAATGAVVISLLAFDLTMPTSVVTAAVLAGLPLLTDGALVSMRPLEDRLGSRWVVQARSALARSGSRVVAITGSYGKTSTKGLVSHLLGAVTSVVPSPASFNNRMGLARAINEQLTPGTDVFVAEMGTYGPGEIRDMCRWVPPHVAVITAIGPVHLERMGSEEAIARAKREILERAAVAVLSIDHPLLSAIAEEESRTRRVIRCSAADRQADVYAGPDGAVAVGGRIVGRFDPESARAGNVACAIGVVVALGFEPAAVAGRLESLPATPHRQEVVRGERGFWYVDDTFNSNPAGAAAALDLLMSRDGLGRRVVVTPGMVELGRRQVEENEAFARLAAAKGVDTLLVVGRTNRAALVAGGEAGGIGSVIVVATRDEAVAWVRENLGPGDAVLYENDLPDHYP